MDKTKKKQLAAVVFAWVVIGFGFWISKDMLFSSQGEVIKSQEASAERKYSNAEVYATAETIISKYLKSPSSAKFPIMADVQISRLEDNGFRVEGYVDSQNSFGAMLRSTFTTIFQYRNQTDEADVYAVVLDGETLLKRTPTNQ